MKAIRVSQFGGPEVLKLEEAPDPKPGAGQAVVRLRAIGVNPVEVYVRSGKYPRLPQPPYTPGSDGAGVVEVVGEGVTDLKAGDRVYLFGSLTGTYAELALCERSQVYPLPDKISFAQGAALGVPYGTAWRALFQRGRAVAGEAVLVHGASGGVGIAAVQMARAAGLTVIGTASRDRGRRLVLAEGAHYVTGHEITDDPQQLNALTGGRGLHLILEMLANLNLNKDLGALARRGRVVVVGSRGSVEIDPRLTMGNELDVLGMTLMAASPEELHSIHAGIHAGLDNGVLRPVVDRKLPLADAPQAHEAVMADDSYGKIVLEP